MDNKTLVKGILGACNSINALKRANMYAMPYMMAAEVLLHKAVEEIGKTEEYEKYKYISEVAIDK